jgi:hypothetical protein
VLAVLVSLLVGTAADATVWKREVPPIDAVISLARLGFRGVVLAIHYSHATLSGGAEMPFSEVEFEVEEAYAGCRVGDHVTVRQIGGPFPSAPDERLIVADVPRYAVGERYTIFQDDLLHPIAGTLWGLHTRHRLVWADEENEVVVNFRGQPLAVSKDGTLRVESGLRCVLDLRHRDRCAQWLGRDGKPVEDAEVSRQVADWLSPRDFDSVAFRALEGRKPPAGPIQNVSATRKAFTAYLRKVFAPAEK